MKRNLLSPLALAGLALALAFLSGCGGSDKAADASTSTAGKRIPIPPGVQEFFDTKVALPVDLYEDLEAGRVSREEVDARIAAGEFPKLFQFKTIDDLPANLEWEDGMELEEIGSPEAKKGGTFYDFVNDFPRTLRLVGPDAGSSFRPYLLDYTTLQLGRRHPNNVSIDKNGFLYFAELAKEWSIDRETGTIYVRLRPEATWSDGVPITVDDYFYTVYFHTSEYIQDPWYPNYYNRNFSSFVKYDDYTFSFKISEIKPDLTTRMLEFRPVPMHFYGELGEDYVDKFQWQFQPTTGPYVIKEEDINKGRFIRLTRNKDWWARDLPFQRYRFNFDVIHVSVIRDNEKALEAFKKGELDIFPLNLVTWWHDKVPDDDPLVTDGYIHKYVFYNDRPRSTRALWLNAAVPPMDNKDIRIGFQYAMNWDRVIKEYNRGDVVRMRTSGDGFGAFSHPTLQPRSFDVEKALEHFALAGYRKRNAEGILVNEEGNPLSITLTTPWQTAQDELTILQEEARRAGLDLNLDILDLTAGYKKMDEKKHQVAFAGYRGSPEMYPRFWEYYHSFNAYDKAFLPDGTPNPDRKVKPNTNNVQSFANLEMDRLIEKYRGSSSAEEMQALAHRMHEIIYDEATFNPAYYRPHIRTGSWRWVHWPADHNVRIASEFREYYLAWIDEEEKAETLAARRQGKKFAPVIEIFDQYKLGDGDPDFESAPLSSE